MTEHLFLDEHFNILTGEKARAALQQTNDAPYLTDGQGVVQVPKSRWHVAQEFERHFWLERSRDAREDRNQEHFRRFDGYSALRSKWFPHAIELGCGPFTNLRLIAEVSYVKACTLLDPLLHSYLTHPHCTYDGRWLRSEQNRLSRFLGSNMALRGCRRVIRRLYPSVLQSRTRIASLLPHPIEEMPLDRTFDLIVIINVIEHCYDINRVFDNIRRISHAGTIIVFADRYYEHRVVAEWVQGTRYDAGHPLLVDRNVIDAFLDSTCEMLYKKVYRLPWSAEGFDLSHDAVYFIGKVRPSDS
jgi:SAM-dependent methyltransferase